MWEFLKETFKIPVNKENFDRVVQASATQHEEELVVRVDSLKKENRKYVTKVNSLETELSHLSEAIYLNLIMLHK